MSEEFAETTQMRERFMNAVHTLRIRPQGYIDQNLVMAHMGLNQDDPEHINLYDSIARYWVEKRLIEPWASGLSMIQITARGIDYVEGNRAQEMASANITFNVANAYNSIFGTQQQAELNVSFDFRTIETELQHAQQEVERRGGPDARELTEMLAEVEELLRSGSTLEKGRLAGYLEVLQRNGWISGPVAGALLGWAVRAAGGG